MKKIFYFLILLSCKIFAAGPMTHLYFAERWCEIHGIYDEGVKRDFVLGNLFPDIRYIAHIPREWTHPIVYSADDIHMSVTPFEAGMKLHALVDEVREAIVEESGIYGYVMLYAQGYPATLLKFIEEEVLAEFFDGRGYGDYFDWVIEEELLFGLEQDTVLEWHSLIKSCMRARPSWLLWFASYKDEMFGIPGAVLSDWSYLIPELAQQPIFRNHVERILHEVESHLYP